MPAYSLWHKPRSALAAWSDIDLSNVRQGSRFWKFRRDLQDSLYQFHSEDLAEDFAFDFLITASEAGPPSI